MRSVTTTVAAETETSGSMHSCAAVSDDTTVDNWLHHELVDFAGTVVDRMENVIPGYRRAYLFPGQE